MAEAAPRVTTGPPPDGVAGFLHMDMDAFYASVEILRRPELRGKPVMVGGTGRRGVVAAASYEARAFGVRSAMPSARARQLCPQAVFLPGDHSHYTEVSARVMDILRDVTPLVEPLSMDEAFCDVRGVARLSGSAPEIAARIRSAVLEHERLTCSIGVASCKLIAKLATERAKPRPSPSGPVFGSGVHVVEAGSELDFLHPLPVSALWGVGRATAGRLAAVGVETVGELAALSSATAVGTLGPTLGRHLRALARGLDDRPVVTFRRPRSFGHERTFSRDISGRAELDIEAARLADAAARRMRVAGLRARTITLKVRYGDFTTITRSSTLRNPSSCSRDVAEAALSMLADVDLRAGVRLLGVSGSGLSRSADAESAQLCLELGGEKELARNERARARQARTQAAEQVMDKIRDRFGATAIGPAALVRPDRLMRPGSENPEVWGPYET